MLDDKKTLDQQDETTVPAENIIDASGAAPIIMPEIPAAAPEGESILMDAMQSEEFSPAEDSGEEYYDEDEEYYDEDEYYDDEEYYEDQPRTLGSRIGYLVCVLLAAVVLAVVAWFLADDVLALTKEDNVITVVVEETDTFDDVTDKLYDRGLVRFRFLFKIYGKFANAEDIIEPGTFELNQLFDYHALVNALASGSESRKTVTLTFPEGHTCDQIFDILVDNQVCKREDLEDAAANYAFEHAFIQSLPTGNVNRLEGYLFPDTYEFYVNDSAANVLGKFLDNFQRRFDEALMVQIDTLNEAIREKMEAEKEEPFSDEEIENAMMDMNKVVIVASLIEAEAGSDQERDIISSVIYNRLSTRVHELLQIDATVEYALGEKKAVLTENDLAYDSPYNTYRKKGLPPGPISNPGINSIMAALNPRETDFYFYALNNGGVHTFFETYEAHREFTSVWNSDTLLTGQEDGE